MQDELDGITELHALLSLDGHPDFHLLINEDIDRAHGEAHVENCFSILWEAMACRPRDLGDYQLVSAILQAEREAGVYWPA